MPRERTKPPTTAVKRVDFFLQNVMTSGERRRETPKHKPDKQPRINKKVEKIDTLFYPKLVESYVTIMCRNDELNSTLSWVGCLLKDSELLILFAENSQILLKISVIPILLTFIYLVALNLLVNNQLNSSLRHIIVTHVYRIT